jgi:hypothetical protein
LHRLICRGPSPFDRCRFDQKKCEAGIEALGFYHEKKDEQRSVGLGSSHDWSGYAADAFGLMAISHEDPERSAAQRTREDRAMKEWSKRMSRSIV